VEDPADLELVLSNVLKELRERSAAHGNVLEVQRKVKEAVCMFGTPVDEEKWFVLARWPMFHGAPPSC
jgi:hypothetical protein